jgi:hypothetical protein
MPFRHIWRGRSFDIAAAVEHDRCEIEDILAGAIQPNPLPCWKKIVSLIVETAENGPPENNELCRLVADERTDDLHEFCLRGGISVLWFVDDRTIVICSVVLDPQSRQVEISKALELKTDYFKEKKSNADEEI